MKLAVDFGATKVVIAHLDKKGEPLVFNLGNGGLVPCSVFLNTDGSLLFGEIADSRAASYPAHYLRAFKLQLGSNLPVLGDLKAEQLVTEFLKHLFEKVKSDATFRNAHIESVLLTCPVDFTPSQRELLVTAVKEAGAEEVELVTEPESAGVAFCHYSPDTAFKERALVVDWGGSTLDVALVSRSDKFRVLESRYTAGDNTIGGEVFDDCLASYILQNLPRTVILTPVEWWEIMKEVRRVKCELSDHCAAEFSMSVRDRDITVQISRETFESLIRQHVQKAVTLVKKLLDDLSSDEQPEMLVLVGGTTLIPCIKEKLEAATGLPTRRWAEARVAVAKGAALLTLPDSQSAPESPPTSRRNVALALLVLVLALLVPGGYILYDHAQKNAEQSLLTRLENERQAREEAESALLAEENNQRGGDYFLGRNGCPVDYNKAAEYFRKAAEQGHATAQDNLGECYYYGRGIGQDYEEAVKWYHKSAEQGYASAQNNLGVCYENGHGVGKDAEEAVKWYRKAAEQGYASAQNNLGLCYENGRGVGKDAEEAVKWYRKAAEQGDASAQHNLGVCY